MGWSRLVEGRIGGWRPSLKSHFNTLSHIEDILCALNDDEQCTDRPAEVAPARGAINSLIATLLVLRLEDQSLMPLAIRVAFAYVAINSPGKHQRRWLSSRPDLGVKNQHVRTSKTLYLPDLPCKFIWNPQ